MGLRKTWADRGWWEESLLAQFTDGVNQNVGVALLSSQMIVLLESYPMNIQQLTHYES